MLFQTRFHAGIRDGSIRLTYRAWKSARVTPGKSYRFGRSGSLEVRSVTSVRLDSIRPLDAKRAGFEGLPELRAYLQETVRTALRASSRLFRVVFRYAGESDDPRAALQRDDSPEEIDRILERVARMDRLSRHGPWTLRVLRLIRDRPRVVASRLAPRLDRETPAFKADVRKLKNLGLTRSFEVATKSLRGVVPCSSVPRGGNRQHPASTTWRPGQRGARSNPRAPPVNRLHRPCRSSRGSTRLVAD